MQQRQSSAVIGASIRDRNRKDLGSRGGDGAPNRGEKYNDKYERPYKPGQRTNGPGGAWTHSGGGNHGRSTVEKGEPGMGGSARATSQSAGLSLPSTEKERPLLNEKLGELCTCMIGQWVDVYLKNGQQYRGILHSCGDSGDGFGMKLKMASIVKDGAAPAIRGARPIPEMRITGKLFAQMVARDVSLSGDAGANGRGREAKEEIATDTALSRGRLSLGERELKPWKPDAGDALLPNMHLEQSSWSRPGSAWDQFEVNRELFGVETTFNEDLYTTKLEKGNMPELREREKEAARIAREIETQGTRNMHLAEERGQKLDAETEELGEEDRFSSVIRGNSKADSGLDEDEEDQNINSRNDDTFGSGSVSALGACSGDDASTGDPSSPPRRSSILSKSLSASALSSPVRPGLDGDAKVANGVVKEGQSPLQERRTTSGEKPSEVLGFDGLWRLKLKINKAGKGSGRSPYHSPMGRSPMMSPHVADQGFQALNLDPTCPHVDPEVVREFHDFRETKLSESAKAGGKKRRDEQLNDLKSFHQSLKDRAVEPRSPLHAARAFASPSNSRPSSSGSLRSSLPAGTTAGTTSASPATSALHAPGGGPSLAGAATDSTTIPPSSAEKLASTGTVTGLSQPEPATSTSAVTTASSLVSSTSSGSLSSMATGSNTQAAAAPPPAATSAPSNAATSASSAHGAGRQPSSSVGAQHTQKKSTLNPNAKEFKLNPHAKAFTPNVPSATTRTTTTAPPTASIAGGGTLRPPTSSLPMPPPSSATASPPVPGLPAGQAAGVPTPLPPPVYMPAGSMAPNGVGIPMSHLNVVPPQFVGQPGYPGMVGSPGTYPITIQAGYSNVPQQVGQMPNQVYAQQQQAMRAYQQQQQQQQPGPHMQQQQQQQQYIYSGPQMQQVLYGQGQPVLYMMPPGQQMMQQQTVQQQQAPQSGSMQGVQYPSGPHFLSNGHGMPHPHVSIHMQGGVPSQPLSGGGGMGGGRGRGGGAHGQSG